MMRNTPSNNSTNSSDLTPSRKRRSDSSEHMFQSPSQENENIINQLPANDSELSMSDAASSAVNVTNETKVLAPTTSKIHLKVRIKHFHSVAHWTWGSNTKDDVCSICQNPFEGVCPGVKYPGEDCPVVWGKCLHAFHLQCINTWLTSSATPTGGGNPANVKNSCPICRQEWEFSSSNPTPNTGSTASSTANF